ncbi:protein-export chaperone SecB [Donghicola tyrosinivorans]|jgi:preprotein translocase subunit SecB|uniref:Protein-export protein SecB n=1 Tax=Donghicola tyrosinivorans TaxID=1652492 RepID=A0A2T0WY23_9RHOB|nr:protein-export chaperone SecB [Donghicola tyrosinivorans]MEC9196391.1 protein-export chaperone SecB [Pseudomonadota bacterium]PRY91600.1 preprotein translocase subunit SecB [Donghicola tyrosinivorans]
MTEETAGAAPQAQQPQIKMNILAQYIRDMSFENILAQKGANGDTTPELKVNVALDVKKRTAPNQYEVIMKLNVAANTKEGNQPLFLLELEYGGVFNIEGVPENQLHPFLLIECPRQLFPYVRRIVSDVTRDGSFPPLNLEPIDFVALYMNEQARRAQAQQAEAPAVN